MTNKIEILENGNVIVGTHKGIADYFQDKIAKGGHYTEKDDDLMDALIYFDLTQKVKCTYDADWGWYVEEFDKPQEAC